MHTREKNETLKNSCYTFGFSLVVAAVAMPDGLDVEV